nr:XRE family transcriptional regulator [Streptomyces sp. CB02460]
MAGLTGLSQSFLSMLESGTRKLTNIRRIAQFLEGVSAPVGLCPEVPRKPPVDAVPDSLPAVGQSGSLPGLAAQAAAQSMLFAEHITSSNISQGEIEQLAGELARIATDYVHAPLLPLFHDLLFHRDRAFELLKGRQKPGQTRELFLLAGVSCLLLAHASQNLGDERSAMAQVNTASTCAEMADHRGLQAWVKGTAALIAEWSPRGRIALHYTQQARGYAPAGESRIRIAAIEARAAARIGNRRKAVAALDALRRARENGATTLGGLQDFGGILTFPEAKQEYYMGGTYALLGEHALAERHAARAIALYESGAKEDRSYGDEALARLDIVTARLASGEVEGAGEQLRYILRLPPKLRIRQIGSAVRRVGDLLQQPRFVGNGAARELAQETLWFRESDRQRTGVLR